MSVRSGFGYERCLFTKDGWSIYSDVFEGERGQIVVYAHHNECPENAQVTSEQTGQPTNCWHPGDLSETCILCKSMVPEGIQALILLYQWEA